MSEHMTFLPKKELLTLEELDRLCTALRRPRGAQAAHHRGEPLVRRGIMNFFESMSRHLASGALES